MRLITAIVDDLISAEKAYVLSRSTHNNYRKKKEKSKKRSRPEDDEDQVPLTDAQARVQEDLGKFDQLIDSFKPTRKVYAEEDVGDKSFQLRADMIQAAEEDTENVNNKRIAAAKFKMLPRVQEELSKYVFAT